MVNKSLNYTCIFGGGAIRGFAYVGAIKALEELGVNITTYAGSSVGAIFAGLLAVGYNAEELKDIFMQVNYELFKDIHFGFGKDFALSKGEIFLDWVRDNIEKKVYGDKYQKGENPPVTFADIENDLVIITTDLKNFRCKEFSKKMTPDYEVAKAIRISSSMPGLMKPVEMDNSLLVDGDLQKSWPLWKLSKNLCPENSRVLEFRLEGDYEGKGYTAINFMNTVYSCVTSLATDFIIKTYNDKDKFDYIKLNTGSVVVVDFALTNDKREQLMQIGYSTTLNYFSDVLKHKKQLLLVHYKSIYNYIKKISKYIVANKIIKAKLELGSLYMDLVNINNFIDTKFYKEIETFKENFLDNLINIDLLQSAKLNNKKEIEQEAEKLAKSIKERISELENYLQA